MAAMKAPPVPPVQPSIAAALLARFQEVSLKSGFTFDETCVADGKSLAVALKARFKEAAEKAGSSFEEVQALHMSADASSADGTDTGPSEASTTASTQHQGDTVEPQKKKRKRKRKKSRPEDDLDGTPISSAELRRFADHNPAAGSFNDDDDTQDYLQAMLVQPVPPVTSSAKTDTIDVDDCQRQCVQQQDAEKLNECSIDGAASASSQAPDLPSTPSHQLQRLGSMVATSAGVAELAAAGKANSSNARAEWARFMRRTRKKDFKLGAELETNGTDLFNIWLQESEDMSRVQLRIQRSTEKSTQGQNLWSTMKKRDLIERYGEAKAQNIMAKKVKAISMTMHSHA